MHLPRCVRHFKSQTKIIYYHEGCHNVEFSCLWCVSGITWYITPLTAVLCDAWAMVIHLKNVWINFHEFVISIHLISSYAVSQRATHCEGTASMETDVLWSTDPKGTGYQWQGKHFRSNMLIWCNIVPWNDAMSFY